MTDEAGYRPTDDSALRWEDCHCTKCGQPDKKCECVALTPGTKPTISSNERAVLLRKLETWLESGKGKKYACARDYPGGYAAERIEECEGCLIIAAARLLKSMNAHETRAGAAMREAGNHVFCGATPNWIDHAGDCDALPCTCGLSEWLNSNQDLLGITLSPSQKASEPLPCEHLRSEWLGEKRYGSEPLFEMRKCLDCAKIFRVRKSVGKSEQP